MKKVNDLLTCDRMLDLLTLAYVQFMIILVELQKVLSEELKCLCSKMTAVLSVQTVQKTVDVSLLHFYCIMKKYIYCIEMTVYYREMYIYSIYSRHILYSSCCCSYYEFNSVQ